MDKNQLRKELKSLRNRLSKEEVAAKSSSICRKILGMAAYRNAGTAADIHLAAGLPLTSFGRDKKAFRDYLCRGGKPVSFRYEGQDYVITISKVSLYP